MALARAWSARLKRRRRKRTCRVLLIDETSLRRRHRYVTVLCNAETGEVLGVVRHRDYRALAGFLSAQGRKWCQGVKVVVTDGSESYRAAIRSHLGRARHVVDRFHVCRWFAAGLVEVRRRIQRRGPKGTVPAFEPEVFRSRFLLLRRDDRLLLPERERLAEMFVRHPELGAAWAMVQALYDVYEASDDAEADAALWRFADLYAEHELPEFYGVVDTLLKWAPEILAFHATGRTTNGRLEGRNNKLGVLKRMAYGFVSISNFRARAILISPPASPAMAA